MPIRILDIKSEMTYKERYENWVSTYNHVFDSKIGNTLFYVKATLVNFLITKIKWSNEQELANDLVSELSDKLLQS